MNAHLAIVLGLLASAIAMFALNKPRMDAVGLIMVAILPFTGMITMGEALAGFSDPNIVLIGVSFVLGEGLVRTGGWPSGSKTDSCGLRAPAKRV